MAAKILRHPSLYEGLERVPEIQTMMYVESIVQKLGNGNTGGSMTKLNTTMSEYEAEDGRPVVHTVLHDLWRPSAIAHVNSQHATRTYPQDGWVLLTEQDHTFLQFHLKGVGVHHCALSVTFPAREDLHSKLLTIELNDPRIETPLIRIMRSSSARSSAVAFDQLKWNNRPVANEILGVLPASFGANATTPAFDCASEDAVLVELSCMGKGCRIEYEEDGRSPLFGVSLSAE